MTIRKSIQALALVPFVLAACAGEPEPADDAETAAEQTPAAAVEPAPAEPMTFMAEFTPLAESGTTGEVEIRAVDQQTELRVMLSGAKEGVHQGHIHQGTCDAPGSVVTPLDPVTVSADGMGESTTQVDVPILTVMNGQHIVLYHEAGGEPGSPVTCAPIPTHSM